MWYSDRQLRISKRPRNTAVSMNKLSCIGSDWWKLWYIDKPITRGQLCSKVDLYMSIYNLKSDDSSSPQQFQYTWANSTGKAVVRKSFIIFHQVSEITGVKAPHNCSKSKYFLRYFRTNTTFKKKRTTFSKPFHQPASPRLLVCHHIKK